MLRSVTFGAAVLLAVMLGVCANRITYRYDEAKPQLKTMTGTAINLAALDRRAYVVNKQKPATFVGVTRIASDDYVGTSNDGPSRLFDVTTASGKPLAEDFAKSMATAPSSKGGRVTTISLPADIDEVWAIRRMSGAGGKSLLLVLDEWRSEAQLTTYLVCDIHAMIVGPDEAILARKRLLCAENLGGNPRNPIAHAREVVPPAYSRKLQELFSAPEIAGQL